MAKSKKKATSKIGDGVTVMVIKVCLTYNTKIWRRIAIRSDQTLGDLHSVVNKSYERDDDHLWAFYIAPPGVKSRNMRNNTIEYVGGGGGNVYDDEESAYDYTMGDLELRVTKKFYYLFDFGDSWQHTLVVESMNQPLEAKVKYPKVIETHGKAPPQYPDYDDDYDDDDDDDDDDD